MMLERPFCTFIYRFYREKLFSFCFNVFHDTKTILFVTKLKVQIDGIPYLCNRMRARTLSQVENIPDGCRNRWLDRVGRRKVYHWLHGHLRSCNLSHDVNHNETDVSQIRECQQEVEH